MARRFRVTQRRDLDDQRQDERDGTERTDVGAAHDIERRGSTLAAAEAVR